MRVPTRKSQELSQLKRADDNYLSAGAVRQLQDELERLQERERPRTVDELSRTREMGDLSENAAYQMAKAKLMGIDGRILTIKEKLKNAVVVEPGAGAGGTVRVGSTVVVEVGGKQRTYEITGSDETDPAKGRISHVSPIGAALLGLKAGEKAVVEIGGKNVEYRVIEVR